MSTVTLNTKPYEGNGILNGVSTWYERSGGIAAGFQPLTSTISFNPTKTSVKWKLVAPVLQPDATACACPNEVLRSTIVDISVRLDKAATKAERDDILKRIQDLVLTTVFVDSVSKLAQST